MSYNGLVQSLEEEQQDDSYTTEVVVDVLKKGATIDETSKARVVWRLDIDARGWGIKGFDVQVEDDVAIQWTEIIGEDQVAHQSVIIPNTQIVIEKEMAGSGIYPVELTATLGPDNQIVRAKLTVQFPGKE